MTIEYSFKYEYTCAYRRCLFSLSFPCHMTKDTLMSSMLTGACWVVMNTGDQMPSSRYIIGQASLKTCNSIHEGPNCLFQPLPIQRSYNHINICIDVYKHRQIRQVDMQIDDKWQILSQIDTLIDGILTSQLRIRGVFNFEYSYEFNLIIELVSNEKFGNNVPKELSVKEEINVGNCPQLCQMNSK